MTMPSADRINGAAKILGVEPAAVRAALAQSDAEPFPQPQRNDGGKPCGECQLQPGETCDVCGAVAVGWQLVPKKPTKEMIQAAYARQHDGTTVLYFKMWNAMLDAAPTPPRPDASAGLIEAAEWHEKEMSRDSYYARRIHEDSAKHFRSLAADRSGK